MLQKIYGTRQFRPLKLNYDRNETDYAEETKKEENPSNHKPSTRSSTTPRPAPSMPLDLHSDYRKCVICGNERAWEKRKGKLVREKFRLCEFESSNKFLNAMNFHKDDVLSRCADLSCPEDVYAADLYCHVSCFKQYVFKSTQNNQCINEMNATSSIKYNVFNKIISDLDPLIKDGYGFTLTEIREMMMAENDSVEVYNRDVS